MKAADVKPSYLAQSLFCWMHKIKLWCLLIYLHIWHLHCRKTVQQKAFWRSQQLTSGPWCHHLTAVQMSAYLWLCVDYSALGVSGRCPAAQQHNKKVELKLKMALSKTPHTKHPLKASTSTFTTAIVCEIRSSTIYWYFPLCCWRLSSLCVYPLMCYTPLSTNLICGFSIVLNVWLCDCAD